MKYWKPARRKAFMPKSFNPGDTVFYVNYNTTPAVQQGIITDIFPDYRAVIQDAQNRTLILSLGELYSSLQDADRAI